jgi:hypothetical protein
VGFVTFSKYDINITRFVGLEDFNKKIVLTCAQNFLLSVQN